MIYLTFIISMSLFVWAMVIVCKVTKRLSFMRKNPNEPRVLLTRNEELRLVWLLISYLLMVCTGLCYVLISGQSDIVKSNSDVLKGIGRISLYVMLVPPNSFFIIATVVILRMNKKIRAKIESNSVKTPANRPLILGICWAYFITTVICTVCYKMGLISDGVCFSILAYGTVIVLGLMVIALRTPARVSDRDESEE